MIASDRKTWAVQRPKTQFLIGGEATSGQSITTLVRLALLDQMALMRLPAVQMQWYSGQSVGNYLCVHF